MDVALWGGGLLFGCGVVMAYIDGAVGEDSWHAGACMMLGALLVLLYLLYAAPPQVFSDEFGPLW